MAIVTMSARFPAIMAQRILKFIITVIIIGAIYYLLAWAISATGLGDPFAKVARIGLIIVACFALINAILVACGKAWIDW